MKFDIVIPIRNGQDHVIECLNSLIFQENIGKIIVINDGSTDMSEMIINKYIEKHTNVELHSTAPRGVSAARNFGVRFTSSKYIAFLDSDDYWMRGK
jgi:glycosyltransferase involved in cell wall biosynthesis